MTAALARARHRRGAAAGAALALAIVGTTVGTASAKPAAPAEDRPPAAKAAPVKPGARVVSSSTVTLVTGDRFRVDVASDGSQQASPLSAAGKAGDRSGGTFAQYTFAGDTYVIPAEAAPYVGRTLDARLFNVGHLVRAKLDDRNAKTLPVKVKASAAKAEALPATSVTASSGGAVRAKVAKKDAAGFGKLLAENWRTASRKGAAADALPGVAKVELAQSGKTKLPADPMSAQPLSAKTTAAAGKGLRYRNLTIDAIGLDGKPGVMVGFAHNVDDGRLANFGLAYPGTGKRTFSVPEGTYSIEVSVFTGPADDLSTKAALVIQPEVAVGRDTTVTLDARQAVPYKTALAAPPKPDMPRIDFLSFARDSVAGDQVGVLPNGLGAILGFYNMRLGSASYTGYNELFVTPTRPVTKGKLHYLAMTSLSAGTEEDTGAGSRYDLLFPSEGAVPAAQSRTVAQADLTTLRSKLRNPASDYEMERPRGLYSIAYLPWTFAPTGMPGSVDTGDRTDYLYSSAPDQVLWEHAFVPGKGERLLGERRTLRPGQVVELDWNGGPDVPSSAAQYVQTDGFVFLGETSGSTTVDGRSQVCAACRQGDIATVFLRHGADSDPLSYAYAETSRLRFFRDGALAYTTESEGLTLAPDPADLPLVPRPADYRLVWDVDSPDAPGTSSTTDWTFRSAPGGAAATLPRTASCAPDASRACAFLPLLFVNHALKLDGNSEAPAGKPFDIAFRVSHQQYQAAPKGVTATVQVSYDDGENWSEPVAAAARPDGTFGAGIEHPEYKETTRWVSLRVTARDGDGGAVTQTNIRAYRLNG
ncbi:hypothetical protein ACIBF1_15645 [Spirillospora sp. NPDC050679]